MIAICIGLRNIWSKRWGIIKTWHGRTFIKNKFWEIQINKTNDIIGIDFRITAKQSHAGSYLALGFIGYEILFNIYDNRHWDSEKDNWVKYQQYMEH